MFNRLKEKTILITGASSGIGEAIARSFLLTTQGNVRLLLIARRFDKLETLRLEFESQYPEVQVHNFQLDLSQSNLIIEFGEKNKELLAGVDILVNNAGFALGLNKIGDIDHADLVSMLNTNLTGLITLTQVIVPHLIRKNSGDVVNISSISGKDPYIGGAIYCTTKTAVSTFTDVLRKETKDSNLRVMEILPGLVETEFAVTRHKGDVKEANKVYELYQTLRASDVAEQVTWITSRDENVVIAESTILPNHQSSMRDADMVR